jgi:phthiocerol/phenolphthiocerol synthesis type-I polyketide synthase E
VHLVRHPAAVMESVVRTGADRTEGAGGLAPWRLAERTWASANENLAAHRAGSGAARHHVVRYEDLVLRPADEMRRLCAFLGLPYAEELVRPYDGARMTDGVRFWSAPLDDPDLRTRDRIVPELAEAWRDVVLPFRLEPSTALLARELGYTLT